MNDETTEIDIDDIVYREDLYPRSLTDHKQVQVYSDSLEVLPPIEINQANILIDGWHRWTAHKKPGSHIALIIQPTQWKSPDKNYTDHILDICKLVKSKIVMRIQCPYESQQATPQMVEWAKDEKKVLVLSREIIVWEV